MKPSSGVNSLPHGNPGGPYLDRLETTTAEHRVEAREILAEQPVELGASLPYLTRELALDVLLLRRRSEVGAGDPAFDIADLSPELHRITHFVLPPAGKPEIDHPPLESDEALLERVRAGAHGGRGCIIRELRHERARLSANVLDRAEHL